MYTHNLYHIHIILSFGRRRRQRGPRVGTSFSTTAGRGRGRRLLLLLCGGIGAPGVLQDVLQVDPVLRPHPQTGVDQVAARLGRGATKVQAGQHDLLVLLEGDVALHHVEEEDAKGPHSGRATQVALAGDPLGGCVHTGS